MKPHELHFTNSTWNGSLPHIRSARNGATNAVLSVLVGPSQMTHFDTWITNSPFPFDIGNAQSNCSEISIL